MRKTGLIVTIVVVLLGIAVLGGPRFFIGGAEERLREATEALSMPYAYRMKLESIEPGWFSSQAVTIVELSGYYAALYDQRQAELNLPFDPPHLELHHVIRHGPLIWTDKGPELALSIVETTLRSPESLRPMLQEYFGDQALLTVDTSFGFDGSTISEFSTPPRIAPHPDEAHTVDAPWPGMTGTMSTSGETVTFEGQVPAWTISGDGGSASLSAMKISANLKRFRDITWLGDFWLTMDRLEINDPSGDPSQSISVAGVRYGGETIEEEGLIDSRFVVGIESGEGQGATLGANAYKVEVLNLDADAFADLYGALIRILEGGSEEDFPARLIELYTQEIPNLLKGSEIASLGFDYDFKTPQMQMSGTSAFRFGLWDGILGARLDIELGKTRFGDMALEAGETEIVLSDLSNEPIAAIWREMTKFYAASLEDPKTASIDPSVFSEPIRGLITADTKLTIEPFKLSFPTGDLTAKAQASLHEPETIDWDDPQSPRQRLNATLDAQAAEAALVRMMALASLSTYKTALAQQGLPSDTPTALSYAEEGAKAQLIPIVGQGLLLQEGGDYKLNLRLEGGRLFVNGNEIANPMMVPPSPQ